MFFRNPTIDLLLVVLVVLLIWGPKRLPGLGKQLGQGLREFKEGITGENKDETPERPEITQASAPPAPTAAPPVPTAAPERQSAEVGSRPKPS
jgi:sec-independent protein translocase protein TatA